MGVGEQHWPREHPHGSSQCRCSQALSSPAKATTGLRERLKWRIRQIKPHKPQSTGRIVPLSASKGHYGWLSPFALALLGHEHPLSQGGMVSAHLASPSGSTCCCCLYQSHFLCSSYLHTTGLLGVHTYPCQQTENFLFLEVFVRRGNLFLMRLPG